MDVDLDFYLAESVSKKISLTALAESTVRCVLTILVVRSGLDGQSPPRIKSAEKLHSMSVYEVISKAG